MAWKLRGIDAKDGTELEWEAALPHLLEASPDQAALAEAVCHFGQQASSILALYTDEDLAALRAEGLAVKEAVDTEAIRAAWETLAGHIDIASEELHVAAGRPRKPNETMQAPQGWRLETASELFLVAAEKAWLANFARGPGIAEGNA